MEVQTEQMTPIQLMLYTGRLHKSAFERSREGSGPHRSQQMILIYLFKCKRSVSQTEIAGHFKISPAAVAVMLKKLEAAGQIERRPCPGNARRNEITLSEKSREEAAETRRKLEALDKIAFEGIGEAEQKAFTETLLKIQKNIKSYCPEAADIPAPPFQEEHKEMRE